MQLENTAIRLKKIMKEHNLRQVDLLELLKPFCKKYNVKINKSDISQYLSGKVKPGQEKLSMLGMALNVNESWLMGYDVEKERRHYIKDTLTEEENIILKNYNKLNDLGRSKLLDYSNDLIGTPKYIKTEEFLNAAHDDDLTSEEKAAAEEIIRKALERI